MPTFFYTDANGRKQGPINDQQLQALATQGIIGPITPLETESGYKGTAGQIPGLTFGAQATPVRKVPTRESKKPKTISSWLSDWSFQDIRIADINRGICRIVYTI